MSTRASRLCAAVSDQLPAATTKKHILKKSMRKPVNERVRDSLVDERKEIHNKRYNVLLQNRDTTSYHNPLLSSKLRSYRYEIQDCKTIDEVHGMLSYLSSISKGDLSILCDEIMKQCIKLQHHKECLNILQSMYKNQIPRSLASYNIIFHGYVTYDNTQTAINIYHDYMLKYDDDLHPNIVTANTLLSGCKHRADIDLAKQIWNDIITPFNIEPNIATYVTLMTIYGRAGLADHCYSLFTNMITQERIEPDTGACGALLTAYSIKGDVIHCHQILQYMQINGITITIIEYCTLMKCYLLNEQPLDALNIYHNLIIKLMPKQSKLNPKTIKIIAMIRMSCYGTLIEQILDKQELTSSDIKNVKRYFKVIMQEIPYDVKLQLQYEGNNFYDYLDYGLLQKMLNTLIRMNNNNHRLEHNYENEMLSFFENGLKNNEFGFWSLHHKNILDFHLFRTDISILILRYFISFERNLIETKLNYNIKIIVGMGTHSKINIRKDIKNDENSTSPTANAILKEVSSWNPPVKINKLENGSIFALDSNDLNIYLKENKNNSPWFTGRRPK